MLKNKNKKHPRRGIHVVAAKDGRQLNLVKIGELAAEFKILPSTINFYTREGLLPEDARSRGGYRLYHRDRAMRRIRHIDYLQNKKRLTIGEIKKL